MSHTEANYKNAVIDVFRGTLGYSLFIIGAPA
jgi:hypothetical protein